MNDRREEEQKIEGIKGCKEGYPLFVHAKRGCCDELTVIQTGTYSRDETVSEQAWLDKNNHHTY